MRLLHTSDWHLGRGFHGVGLQHAQETYLDHVVGLIRQERLDAVLVSGDIYDRALPGPDTVKLLDDALSRMLDAGAVVVLSSGNHDSAIRLGFGARAMERAGLHIRTGIEGVTRPVRVGDVSIIAVPYLEPAVHADRLGASERTHAAVLRRALAPLQLDDSAYNVVMAHAFVTGATSCQSERDISVGGVGAVPVGIFDAFDYVALGHLHGPQVLTSRARYSGSPVAMSFSEADHVKGSVVIDTTSGQQDFVPAPVERPLARLRGSLEDLLTDRTLSTHESSYCQITLTDPTRPLGAMDRVRARFPHTLQLLFDQPATQLTPRSYATRVRDRTDLDICCDFLPHVRGGAEADEQERRAIRRAFAAVGEQQRITESESQSGVA